MIYHSLYISSISIRKIRRSVFQWLNHAFSFKLQYFYFIFMIKSKQEQLKKKQGNVERSRSRSLSPQRSKEKLGAKTDKRIPPNSSRTVIKKKSPLMPALAKSQSKNSLKKSVSAKKLNKSSSLPRVGSSPNKNTAKKQSIIQKDKKEIIREKIKTKDNKPISQQQIPSNTVKSDEKQMGLIFIRPEHDKIIFKALNITDPVFDKYLDMISNDNDANYLMNALPELRSFKKEDETEGRDFVSGRISRLSGIFENLSVDKIITPLKKVPNYYAGQCGKNITLLRIMLQTKFKVEVDLGCLQYSLDGDKLTIFRIYISKIYRRMNYVGYIYLQAFKALMSKHPGADRWSIFILEKNFNVHKFFKYLGFHIEKIATQSKNRSVDYFQEFTIKKKELSTVIGSMCT